jgi:hypothetical protein
MAFLALVASVAGAAAFTVMSAWVVWILWRGGWSPGTDSRRIDALAYSNYAYIAVAAITISALGLAINRRTIKVDGPGGTSIDLSGGSDDTPPPSSITTTTKTEVQP